MGSGIANRIFEMLWKVPNLTQKSFEFIFSMVSRTANGCFEMLWNLHNLTRKSVAVFH